MAKQTFDEDEDFAPKKGAKGAAKDTDEPKGKTQPGKRTMENEEELDCDWNDESLMRKKDPLPRIRPDKGKAVRFAILPFVKPKRAFNHYIDKKGTFRCLSTEDSEGVCCTSGKAGNANLSIVALAAKYVNCDPKTGKYDGKYKVTDTECEIGHVSLSRSNYTAINKLVEDEVTASGESESVFDFDIIMTHNETTGIGYTLARASRTPRWKKDEAVSTELEEAAKPFLDGKLLTSRLGRKQSAIEWKALLASLDGGEGEDGDNEDL